MQAHSLYHLRGTTLLRSLFRALPELRETYAKASGDPRGHTRVLGARGIESTVTFPSVPGIRTGVVGSNRSIQLWRAQGSKEEGKSRQEGRQQAIKQAGMYFC